MTAPPVPTGAKVAAAFSRSDPASYRVPLDVVPTGTANLWSRTVGVHGESLDAAADFAVDGPARDSDLA